MACNPCSLQTWMRHQIPVCTPTCTGIEWWFMQGNRIWDKKKSFCVAKNMNSFPCEQTGSKGAISLCPVHTPTGFISFHETEHTAVCPQKAFRRHEHPCSRSAEPYQGGAAASQTSPPCPTQGFFAQAAPAPWITLRNSSWVLMGKAESLQGFLSGTHIPQYDWKPHILRAKAFPLPFHRAS